MNYTLSQQSKNAGRTRGRLVTALVLACVFGTVAHAAAQTVAVPPTPKDITPPRGSVAFLVGHAYGTQGYVCLPDPVNGGTSWTINPARPEATLFANFFGQPAQIITHFASLNANPNDFATKPVPLSGNATWQSSFDSSKVWAVAVGHIDAGTDRDSCPNSGAIPCLLLQSVGNQQGPTGGRLLDKVTFVQRLNTKGGAAPTTACRVGQAQLVPYQADYFFYHGGIDSN